MGNINENRKLMIKQIASFKTVNEGMGMSPGKDNRLMIDLENIIGSEVEHTTKKNGRVSVITSFSIPGGQNVLEVEESYDGIWVVTLRAKKGMKIWANEFEFGFSDIEDEATAMKAAMKMVKKHVNLFR